MDLNLGPRVSQTTLGDIKFRFTEFLVTIKMRGARSMDRLGPNELPVPRIGGGNCRSLWSL